MIANFQVSGLVQRSISGEPSWLMPVIQLFGLQAEIRRITV
jgi:hypothetical protein